MRRWWSGRSQRAVCGIATHSRAKALLGRSAGADDGDALGCRVLFEGVVEVVWSVLHVGFSGGNP